MKIELEVSDKHEGTAEPWWMIVDPQQNFSKGPDGVSRIAMMMITGPFFSREEAEGVLRRRRYNFGKGAVVWCASGCDTIQYRQAYRLAEKQTEETA